MVKNIFGFFVFQRLYIPNRFTTINNSIGYTTIGDVVNLGETNKTAKSAKNFGNLYYTVYTPSRTAMDDHGVLIRQFYIYPPHLIFQFYFCVVKLLFFKTLRFDFVSNQEIYC